MIRFLYNITGVTSSYVIIIISSAKENLVKLYEEKLTLCSHIYKLTPDYFK